MTNLKAIIVDDERLARLNLRKLLEAHRSIEIAGEADSIGSAVEMINLLKPQLIFLDIQLSGETGFDLLELIDNSIKIIFVTAFDEYALRAFEVNATDYLLKPVNPERLKVSVERIITNGNSVKTDLKKYEYSDSIYARLNNYTSKFIKISSISFIEPVGNYSKIVTCDGKHCLVLKTLKQWQDELPGKFFIRIHRSCIVNIEQIDRVEKLSNTFQKVFLKNIAEPLEVSRRFAQKLKNLN
jgi:two-component system, LytTR family, response regulator